jgi:hypothetical protein
MGRCPDVREMTLPFSAASNVIMSPKAASAMAWRREPAPESLLLVTMSVAAWEQAVRSASPIPDSLCDEQIPSECLICFILSRHNVNTNTLVISLRLHDMCIVSFIGPDVNVIFDRLVNETPKQTKNE